ncbi:hypothetical protein E4U58_006252 [Claviceps cyperi]|nr:hypothetical protein E4U58_006252 [Claviceps cyperi]
MAATLFDVLDESVASLARRDSAQDPIGHMETILKNIEALTNSTDMYSGNPTSAFPIVANHDSLLHSISQATKHAKNMAVPTETESAAIISFIHDKIFPAISRTLSSIKSKKDLFVDFGETAD